MSETYEAPKIEVAGSVTDLTGITLKYRHHLPDGVVLVGKHGKQHPLGS